MKPLIFLTLLAGCQGVGSKSQQTMNDSTEHWMRPKQIYDTTGVTARRLRYHKDKGFLKKVILSPGSSDKGGRVFYELNEVKKVFLLNNS